MHLQPVPDFHLIVAAIQDLDSHLHQRRGIRLFMKEIIPQELDHIPLFQEHLQVLEGCFGPGIAIIHTLLFELFRPFFLQFLRILHLIPLQAASIHIGSIGNTLEMDYLRERLVYHPVAGLSHLEGQIRVFAVCRGKPLIETADLLPERIRQQDRGARDIVHILHIVIFRFIRIVQPAIVPAGAVAPDDTARFLKPAVRIDQFGAHHADGRITLNQIHQTLKPARCHLRIVI